MDPTLVVVIVAAVGCLGAVVIVVMRSSARMTRQIADYAESERQISWTATVIRTEIQRITTSRGYDRQLVVHYRRDDSVAGTVFAYEKYPDLSCASPMSYYKDGPPYLELIDWTEGTRLHKPLGKVFPHRVDGSQTDVSRPS